MALAFDPQAAPTVAQPPLPAVPAWALAAPALRARFAAPPAWEPEIRIEPRFTDKPVRDAAVLIPIVQRGGAHGPTVLLTQRTDHLHDHAGQISFPGGRKDDGDTSSAHTALREAREEIGLRDEQIEVLGTLPHYLTGTAYNVSPVVGLVQPPFELIVDPFEVAEAFEVPLAYLMDPAHHRLHKLDFDGKQRHYFSIPYHDGERRYFIWGATAAMLRNLYRFLIA